MIRKPFTPLLLAAILLSGAIGAARAADDARPLRIVASTSIVGDWVHAVAGKQVKLQTLVEADGDPHAFQALPSHAAAISKADVVFYVGLDLEPWLEELEDATRSQAKFVPLSAGLELIRAGAAFETRGQLPPCCAAAAAEAVARGEEAPADPIITSPARRTRHTGHDGHNHDTEFDPHVWLDVRNAMSMVLTISEILAEADPAHAETYADRAENYLKKLRALDTWLEEQARTIPTETRHLITQHDAFAYFARRYGFTIPVTILESITTEISDPSAKRLAQIAKQVRKSELPAIFAERGSNTRIVEQVAREAGVKVVSLHVGGLGKKGTATATYIGMMRANMRAISQALGASQATEG